ncbi:UDP-glucuronosyltransferase 2B17-like [Spodoptera litura]|uniref:UDP-glucuronosyltransferase n=1 Tax=Spodoptera litura TaxID=69820 RepID=A0A9J7EWG3_SPOLT|nr:UDP-glucuronosyltransferase 2B17-like [Spodoptera litura]
MSHFLIALIASCVLILNQSEAARILGVFPVASISHQVVFRPITQELVRRGHTVTVITPDPAFPKGETPQNLTEIDVHDISYDVWNEKFMSISKGKKSDLYQHIERYLESIVYMFDAQLQDKNVRNLIEDKSKQFDLILLESSARLGLIFSHIYKAPVIMISSYGGSFDNYDVVGAPRHPFLYPICVRQRLHNLSLWEKITELYLHLRSEEMAASNYAKENAILRKHFGSNIPKIEELNNNVHMLFLNINPVFEGIRPVPPTVVFMGGLHQKPVKELPKDLKNYLDSSKNGVIYLSFGTNVDPTQLPSDFIQTLINALSKLPYDVLWKWNGDELPGRTENIRISKWLPQSDLLRHPKIKLFITQGGLQSTDEAIIAGVPLIGIPMLGDQWFNVEKYIYHKIGLGLDMETVTEEDLINAVKNIIHDESYRQNIIKLRNAMHDQPQSPLERAVWWTEHVLRHGGARHLRGPAANMSWAEYLELELVFTLLFTLLVVITILIVSLRFMLKALHQRVNQYIKLKQS